MNLFNAMKLYMASDGMGPGAIGVSTPQYGVTSRNMKMKHGLTQVAADGSATDLASHHLWQEPSSTDTTVLQWQMKRALEKRLGRNADPFEADAEIYMHLKNLKKGS